MKVSLTFNKRNKEGFYPVVLTLVERGSRKYLNTQVFVRNKFKGVEDMSKDEDEYEGKKNKLAYLLYQAKMYINNPFNIQKEFDVQCEEIRSMLQLPLPNRGGLTVRIKAEAKTQKSLSVLLVMENYISRIGKTGTKENYLATYNRLKDSHGFVKFADIDSEWLYKWQSEMAKDGLRNTTIRQHLVRLHSVFTYAMDNLRIIDNMNAWRGFKFPMKDRQPQTYLTPQQLADLRDYPLQDPKLVEARDMFMLSFYLCGINTSDLLELEGLKNGRVTYRRNKTGALIDVPCPPEAIEIIRKYKGKTHLLKFIEETNVKFYSIRWQHNLKKIGYYEYDRPHGRKRKVYYSLIDGLTPYDARRAFASIGANHGAQRDVVAKCLGHSWAQVTDLYIAYDRETIDRCALDIVRYSLSFKGRSKDVIDAEIKLRNGLG